MNDINPHPDSVTHYAGRGAAMATKHGKTALVRPALFELLQLDVVEVPVDTDTLGTFSGEIQRSASPLHTAIAKARMGMRASGHLIGIASEGTIGPSPSIPFVHRCTELVVLVDDILDIIITGTEHSYDLVAVTADVDATSDLTDLLRQGQFPEHAMIVSALDATSPTIIKGIRDLPTLRAAIRTATTHSTRKRARVETDVRAHHCPSRRPIIERAAHHLATRAATSCPACSTPGFGPIRNQIGVPCAWCGRDTDTIRARIHGCVTCPHRTRRNNPDRTGRSRTMRPVQPMNNARRGHSQPASCASHHDCFAVAHSRPRICEQQGFERQRRDRPSRRTHCSDVHQPLHRQTRGAVRPQREFQRQIVHSSSGEQDHVRGSTTPPSRTDAESSKRTRNRTSANSANGLRSPTRSQRRPKLNGTTTKPPSSQPAPACSCNRPPYESGPNQQNHGRLKTMLSEALDALRVNIESNDAHERAAKGDRPTAREHIVPPRAELTWSRANFLFATSQACPCTRGRPGPPRRRCSHPRLRVSHRRFDSSGSLDPSVRCDRHRCGDGAHIGIDR